MSLRPPSSLDEVRSVFRELDRRVIQLERTAVTNVALADLVSSPGGVAAITQGQLIVTDKHGHWVTFEGTSTDGQVLSFDSTNRYGLKWDTVDAAGAVMETDYNAQTILAATLDDTPATLTVDEQTLVGRITAGNVAALTAAQVRTLLDLVIGTDVLAQQAIGIADDNLLEVDDADAADNDYARFTANGLEGRSYAEVLADIGAAVLAGLAGGQTLQGGTAASEALTLQSTAHATRGKIISADEHEFATSAAYDAVVAHGSVSGTENIDWTQGNIHTVTASGTLTLTFTAPSGPTMLHLKVTAGAQTVNLPTIQWPDGTPPTFSTSNFDWIHLIYDGTNYDGGVLVNYS